MDWFVGSDELGGHSEVLLLSWSRESHHFFKEMVCRMNILNAMLSSFVGREVRQVIQS